jgi:uncharacterized protein YjbI with pentapeptide repeats
MRSRKNQKRSLRLRGGVDSSVCQALKTQEECVVCKWNTKTAKCGKATAAAAKPKRVAKAKAKGCPALDKPSCDSNAECLWNAKTNKCRKHTVKKPPVDTVKAKAKAKAKASPVKAVAAATSPDKPKGPVKIPENKKFMEQDLEGADFSGMDLTRVVFFSCNLKNAKFQNADLTDTRFSTCDLDGANFSDAKILDAEFSYCYVGELRGAVKPTPLLLINSTVTSTRFQNCRFSNSNFSGTTFEHCDFDETRSDDANFSGCKFTPHPTIVRKYDSTLTIFRECHFSLSNFTNADFRGCDFNSSRHDNFEDCAVDERCGNAFNGCVFTGAKFPEKVNMCSFADAVLTGSDISDPKKDIQGCYFDANTEAEDVGELKRRAIPPEDEDEDEGWNSPLQAVKQKSPSPVAKPSSPSPAAPPSLAGNKCVKQTQKKYLERPSPPYSAADCCGMTLEGNDGKSYISVANAKGVCAWKIVKK